MYVVAVLRVVSEDDGMVWVETGCVNGNGKKEIAILNEEKCFKLTNQFREGILKNWDKVMDSAEYTPYKLFDESIDR